MASVTVVNVVYAEEATTPYFCVPDSFHLSAVPGRNVVVTLPGTVNVVLAVRVHAVGAATHAPVCSSVARSVGLVPSRALVYCWPPPSRATLGGWNWSVRRVSAADSKAALATTASATNQSVPSDTSQQWSN